MPHGLQVQDGQLRQERPGQAVRQGHDQGGELQQERVPGGHCADLEGKDVRVPVLGTALPELRP